MSRKIPRRKNPMSSDKVAWMWLFLLPLAFVLFVIFDIAEDIRIAKVKKRIRKERNRRYLYGGWDFWIDDQGL